ncbi:hypothetical protein [Rhodococcus artemisiae]|uniref:Uncharacterized protein n=1 Tax=Rhodococcus artemisiae TaxID=714159 RepID=A0ABU7LHF7_9NOCA|nr:hypothetical protein [Rhodococcus artemisiae]MEE2060312.1 hypothetical protein [Rhodococcus artemisiae]
MSRTLTLIAITALTTGAALVAAQRTRLLARLGRGTTVRSVDVGAR